MAVCEQSDLPTAMCSHCRGLDQRAGAPSPDLPSREARYSTRCSGGEWIRQGDPIYMVDGEWVCHDCAGGAR